MEERFVVETNILYSFFWKNSPTHKLLHLAASKEEILFSSKIGNIEFSELIKLLSLLVDFKETSEYAEFMEEAKSLFPEHLKDVDFFALALKLDCPLWSNERLHKKQSKVRVCNTDELRELLEKPKKESEPEDNSASESK